MGRLFWILVGIVGAALIALIVNHDSGTLLGLENGQFASFIIISAWAVLIGSSVFSRGVAWAETLKQLTIWMVIILALMAAYVFRFDLQDIGSRFTGGLIPGSPMSRIQSDGSAEVSLIRSNNGHFEADVEINGQSARFLVDTGASSVVLSAADARRAGIDPGQLNYSIETQTANGKGRSARARLRTLTLGNIARQNVRVLVAEPGRLNQSLLGQDFLESLKSYEKRGDRLTLRD